MRKTSFLQEYYSTGGVIHSRGKENESEPPDLLLQNVPHIRPHKAAFAVELLRV